MRFLYLLPGLRTRDGGHQRQYIILRIEEDSDYNYDNYYYLRPHYRYIESIDACLINYTLTGLTPSSSYDLSVRAEGKDRTFSGYSPEVSHNSITRSERGVHKFIFTSERQSELIKFRPYASRTCNFFITKPQSLQVLTIIFFSLLTILLSTNIFILSNNVLNIFECFSQNVSLKMFLSECFSHNVSNDIICLHLSCLLFVVILH